MRQLTKGEKPAILKEKEDEWTAAYVAAVAAKKVQKPERWRDPQIRKALGEETSGKCAYCEALMADVSYPHVEHLIPKKLRPELAHQWTNLTWACQVCNTEKGDFYDETDGLLNPYEDPVASHLHFSGPYLSFYLGALRGEVTVKQLKLNRMDLVHARAERLTKVREMLERWHSATGSRRKVLAETIRLDAIDGEFTAMVQAYITALGFPMDGEVEAAGGL
ncbi:HNH endonuclease [Nocardia otitidiscaviarum]|uniref:HNH endonuclease n=1 Tax=Nocardia otitidiscaviarum TaxID=1823 RepID=UPI001896233F|nr:HNH endonuclease [Nocardia otitidiscaviarum]MBF6177718.1 HNH endonuclease [Nocardia otitidiscaviarum]